MDNQLPLYNADIKHPITDVSHLSSPGISWCVLHVYILAWYQLMCPTCIYPRLVSTDVSHLSSPGISWCVISILAWYQLMCHIYPRLVSTDVSHLSSPGINWCVPSILAWYQLMCHIYPRLVAFQSAYLWHKKWLISSGFIRRSYKQMDSPLFVMSINQWHFASQKQRIILIGQDSCL